MRRGRSAFACVQTEGGLLPSDLLERIAAGDKVVPGLNVTDYHLVGTETFGEAVSRAWSRLVAAWKAFAEAAAKLPDSDLGTAVTRERWLLPLFQELGYGRLTIAKAVELERRTFAISHFWKNSPIHTLGFRIGLDQRQKGVAGAAMASPHGLVQDFLNRSDDHLWAFVTNGYVLRILRDNRSLTRQAYVEFDLQAIMEGAQYAEFALLWMICHESRVEADKPEECWLEKWFQLSKDEGVRALDKLRASVKVAIEQLGSGLLRHRANVELRDALARGDLAAQDYYRQLLRLVYRLIFLFAAEERGALLDPAAPEVARKRYLDWYSTLRLRRLAERRRGGPHPDLWQGLKLVMARLREGCPELGLPALGSFLWTDEAAPWPLRSEIANEDLLAAVRALCATRDAGVTQTVNWRLVGAAELGSIYESLLELHPRIEKEAARFELGTAAGHERKTTGSYYTPSSLVDCLLDSALDPVLAEAAKKPEPEQAILDLKVCDPACGSGHFLVAAARRIARRLAQVRSGDEEPSPTAMQHALRDVVGKCLFGVDLNPMAVELCKVSLWMEALEPGRPLSFLDGHIQCGNSLLGATPALLRKGIPDEAFDAIEGDDKKIASALKKRNKQERKGQTALLFDRVAEEPARYDVIAGRAVTVEQKDDASIETLRCKERLWKGLVESGEYRHAAFLADAWCAAFVWPKVAEHQEAAITEDLWQRMKAGPDKVPARTREIVERLKVEYHFFHWHLAFPQVFRGEENEGTGWGGGFDCVLGNPPWEHVEIMEEEFFATTRPDISGAANAAARKKAIARLEEEDPQLFADFLSAQRGVDAETHLLRSTGRFPLCARGRINTYAVFAELNQSLISSAGQVGCILPSGIATDDTTKLFFQDLIGKNSLRSLYHFENEDRIFPGVHHAFRFVLLTVGYDRRNSPADLVFFARQVAQLADDERHFSLLPDEFDLLNPNTGTCPMFRWRRDAEIAKTIYRRVPVLVRESRDDEPEVNLWRVSFRQGIFNMASDSGLFRTREQLEENGWTLSGNIFVHGDEKYLPLYEAKMVHHFNHCFGTYEGQTEAQGNQGKLPEATPEQHADPTFVALPYYWVPEREVEDPLAGRWDRSWLLGWRDICRSTDQRTVIAAVIRRAGVGNKLPLFLSDKEPASLYANLCSFVFDYCSRQKVGGTSMTYFILKQLPILSPTTFTEPCIWWSGETIAAWLRPRVLELTYTAWDLQPFARDVGYDGPPFRWDEARRFLLRAELDAAFFHLYGIARDDVDYIMETFPIVKRKDEKAHGEYRTKRVILEIYDEMQRAADTGVPYQTRLTPPPADPAVAHPARGVESAVPRAAAVAAELIAPDLAAIADGAWATPIGVTPENVTLFTLVDLLGRTGGADAEKLRLAALIARKPVLAIPFLADADKAHWQRVIGAEAQPLPANVVALDQVRRDGVDRAWRDVVQQLRGTGALAVDTTAQRWSTGGRFAEVQDLVADKSWVAGRTSWAIQLLAEIECVEAEQNLVAFVRSVGDGTAEGAVS